MHVPGVGAKTERKIWKASVLNWDSFLDNSNEIDIGTNSRDRITYFIEKSTEALKKKDHNFLLQNFPAQQHWRVYPDLKCCFLDIETTGLSKNHHDITTIGLYNGKESKIYVQGKNLNDFNKEFSEYNAVVTFNGRCFDMPFLSAKYPKLNVNKFHIDLRFVMQRLGYSGGLKRVEKDIGIIRDDDLQEVDGFEAVRLWRKYQRGDDKALELLIKYNIADIKNLKTMMDFAFEKMRDIYFLSLI